MGVETKCTPILIFAASQKLNTKDKIAIQNAEKANLKCFRADME